MEGDISLWLLSYFPWLVYYVPLLAFLAPIIGGGELGVIAVAFLFVKNLTGFLIITISSCVGMVTMDSIWFFIARSKLFIKFKEWKKISKQYKSLESNIEKVSHGKDLLIISIAKLLVGTRILLVLYMGGRKISFARYLAYNSIVNLLWAGILVSLGWLTAQGFNSIISIFENLQLAITFIIIVLVFLYIVQKWIRQRFMKGQEV